MSTPTSRTALAAVIALAVAAGLVVLLGWKILEEHDYPFAAVEPRVQSVPPPWPTLVFIGHQHTAKSAAREAKLLLGWDALEVPLLVVAPARPPKMRWRTEKLGELVGQLQADPRVDPCRIYAAGFSSGGYAAWRLAERHADRIAAIVPLAGGAWRDLKCPARRIPIWAFHGALDQVTPLEMTTDMVADFRACGCPVRVTVYPDADHDGVLRALREKELFRWLVSQRLESCGGTR